MTGSEFSSITAATDRRGFLKRVLATGIGVFLGLIPLGAGLTVLLDPLWRKSFVGGMVRVTTLDAVPGDGMPRKFPVLSTRVDAWNKYAEVPIGAVYLRRTADGRVEALNVVCPHAGCFVDFLPARDCFLCPCHNSIFKLDGKIADRASPASRGMDTLSVEIRNGKEIWVAFQNYEAGCVEKIPIA